MSFNLSERCYRTLLSLYPASFRARFGEEMEQTFRDCSRDALKERGLPGMVRLWLKTLRDLSSSIPSEHVRESLKKRDPGVRVTNLIDSIVILILIAFYLPIVFLFALGVGGGLGLYVGRSFNLGDTAVLVGMVAACLSTVVVYSVILVWLRLVWAHRTPKSVLGLEVPNTTKPAL